MVCIAPVLRVAASSRITPRVKIRHAEKCAALCRNAFGVGKSRGGEVSVPCQRSGQIRGKLRHYPRGDEWRPIPIADVRATALRLIDDRVEPWFSMFSMPTWAWRGIDFDDAVKGKILEAFPVAGVDSYRVHERVVKFLMTRRRAPRECPKCGSASPCVDWIRAEHESRIHVGGEEVESLYECPVHGHFGTNDNGHHFAAAELRCASPSGELVELR